MAAPASFSAGAAIALEFSHYHILRQRLSSAPPLVASSRPGQVSSPAYSSRHDPSLGRQVWRFLDRLATLRAEEWVTVRDAVAARVELGYEAARLQRAFAAAGACLRATGRLRELRPVWAAVQETMAGIDWRGRFRPDGHSVTARDVAALELVVAWAAIALLIRDALPTRDFAALYAPFARVIPAEAACFD